MGSPSKENNVLELILENSPLKEWHFEEISKKAKTTKAVTNKWLKKYTKQGIIKRIKTKGHFPFFTVGRNNYHYNSLKRIYALQQLHQSGLISKLLSLNSAKTIIMFGSTIKGDQYKDSDIDIFILGTSNFNKNIYEKKLNKHIELHTFKNKQEIAEIKTGLIKNIINGYVIKGQIQDLVKVTEDNY